MKGSSPVGQRSRGARPFPSSSRSRGHEEVRDVFQFCPETFFGQSVARAVAQLHLNSGFHSFLSNSILRRLFFRLQLPSSARATRGPADDEEDFSSRAIRPKKKEERTFFTSRRPFGLASPSPKRKREAIFRPYSPGLPALALPLPFSGDGAQSSIHRMALARSKFSTHRA